MKSTLTLYRVKLSRDEKDELLYILHVLFKDVETILYGLTYNNGE